jgi:hypothetical protein
MPQPPVYAFASPAVDIATLHFAASPSRVHPAVCPYAPASLRVAVGGFAFNAAALLLPHQIHYTGVYTL